MFIPTTVPVGCPPDAPHAPSFVTAALIVAATYVPAGTVWHWPSIAKDALDAPASASVPPSVQSIAESVTWPVQAAPVGPVHAQAVQARVSLKLVAEGSVT
jgi:hypothetical protein